MSLQLAAKYLASKGRDSDTQLVHMTTGELKSLQDLARAHGTSLTINPDTGLPEAFKLKSLLPLAAGLALGPAGLGLTAAQAGLAAGAIGTLAGGSLEKGIMAGLGAYGGAGLSAGLLGAGAQAAADAAIAGNLASTVGEPALAATQAAETAMASPFSTMGKGISALADSSGRDAFMRSVGGGKGLLQYGLAAAAPLMVTPQPQTTTQMPESGSPVPKYRFERTLNPSGSPSYFTDRYVRLADGGSTSPYSGNKYLESLNSPSYLGYTQPLPTTDEIIEGKLGVDWDYVYDPVTKTYKKVMRKKPDAGVPSGATAAPGTSVGGDGGGGAAVVGSPDYGMGLISLGQTLSNMGLTTIGNAISNIGIGQFDKAHVSAVTAAANEGYDAITNAAHADAISAAANEGYDAITNAAHANAISAAANEGYGAISGGPGGPGSMGLGPGASAAEADAISNAAHADAVSAAAAEGYGAFGGGNTGGGDVGGGYDGGGGCVDPAVLIMLADGDYVPAGTIKVGDMLFAMHEKTLEFGVYPVEHSEEVEQPKAVVSFGDGSSMLVSHSHKFLMVGGEWKQVYQLEPGDTVKAAPGATDKTVTAVEPVGDGPVMKITVKDAHTYVSEGLISHNMKARGGVVRQRYAFGGPVENMSAANVYDMQNARGGVSDMGIDNSTGMQRMARGGISHLGDYSDGGRLLRGPGDGVSDSIPAMIGRRQPARLADGEFVVPARIVSELGNGSTEAGARKLYAMMDRVQRARGKTVGKGKIAKNSRADKYLPA